MPTSSSLALDAAPIAVLLGLTTFCFCRGMNMMKTMLGNLIGNRKEKKAATDPNVEVFVECPAALLINGDEPTVPPPLLSYYVPPPRIHPNRMPRSNLLRFDATAQSYYDNAVAEGHGDEVAWMVESGYLQAAETRAQHAP